MQGMGITIKKVEGRRMLKKFITFPEKLYKNCPQWVPPMRMDEFNALGDKNPALEFCERECYLAYDENGKIVGRVAAIINNKANQLWNEKVVRFGWIDFIEDIEVARTLISAVAEWGRIKGCKKIKGPLGFTDMDKEGLLVEGFEHLAPFTVIYNYPYYATILESLGFTKDVDWTQKMGTLPEEMPASFRKCELIEKMFKVHILKGLSMKELKNKYGMELFHVCNASFEPLYEFSPLTDRQIKVYLDLYSALLSPEYVALAADENGKIVGFAFCVPSLSKAFKKAKGRLFPFGFIHLLRALKKNDTLEALMIGILPDHQGKGINALMFKHLYDNCKKHGIKYLLANPQLESNFKVQTAFSKTLDLQIFMRRRSYVRAL